MKSVTKTFKQGEEAMSDSGVTKAHVEVKTGIGLISSRCQFGKLR